MRTGFRPGSAADPAARGIPGLPGDLSGEPNPLPACEIDCLEGGEGRWEKSTARSVANFGSGELPTEIRRILSHSAKTVGKWERGLVMPSATNIRRLEKLGLIDGWLGRNGGGEMKGPRSLSPEQSDRLMRSLGFPGLELQHRVHDLKDDSERELVALFRAFPADKQAIILNVLHMVIAKPDRQHE